jgi:NitT/TauT family transport system substrate-binding protein
VEVFMKKVLLGAVAMVASFGFGQAFAADSVTLQLKWVTQAQFGGYYVAKDKGFYEEEGLDVTINPGGPDIAPEQVIAGGGADVIVDWMAAALARARRASSSSTSRSRSRRPAWSSSARRRPASRRKPISRARRSASGSSATSIRSIAWMNKIGMPTEGGAGWRHRAEAELRRAAADPEAGRLHLGDDLQRIRQVLDAGFKPEDLTVFNYSAMGNDLLEDGLYVNEDNLKDPAFFDKMVRFVRASMKGWEYALDNPDEAARIVVDNGGQDENHQKRMMGESRQADRHADGKLSTRRLRPHRQGAARPEDHHQGADGRLDRGDHRQGDQIAGRVVNVLEGAGEPPLLFGRRCCPPVE